MSDLFADDIIFDAPAPTVVIPPDDLSTPTVVPGTVFYLTISTPHTDTFEWHGPFTSFTPIIALVSGLVSASPSASTTFAAALKTVQKNGFTQLIIPDATRKAVEFMVLRVECELNAKVKGEVEEGHSVFTVVRTGPMALDIDALTGKVRSGKATGRATTSSIVGSYTARKEARAAAEAAMTSLIENESPRPTPKMSFPANDAGGGLIMAMNTRAKWEVRVFFETNTLRDAAERYDADELHREKGMKANLRYRGI
ncbi:hypothetical protein BU23DRAFT_268119 [Bimuria novae-zelandiae CBS 107.79]|uniref:Uncharacterized protein n=1 Tax=Bimuria novae-zelandiae CBS 107.79 TaxID=1447943 RepID=A0A6A5UT86_9PLEO|nr:hypothetical protein BU23DRAFT_268119 [Bimuria novae-zelandiae CBS 107.79]